MSPVPTKKSHFSGVLLHLEGGVLCLFWCGFLPTSTGCHFAENTSKCCREKAAVPLGTLCQASLKIMFSQCLREDDCRCHAWDIQVTGLNCMQKTNIWGKSELSKLENILGLDKKRGNNLYLVCHIFLQQRRWANNYLTWQLFMKLKKWVIFPKATAVRHMEG